MISAQRSGCKDSQSKVKTDNRPKPRGANEMVFPNIRQAFQEAHRQDVILVDAGVEHGAGVSRADDTALLISAWVIGVMRACPVGFSKE